MPHRRKKSLVEGQPPKRRGANRRKAKTNPISAMYEEQKEGLPKVRSKRPRKTTGGTRKRSGPVRERGKKVAAAKTSTRRRSAQRV